MPQVELIGLARRYAGVSLLECPGATLGEILANLSTLCPGFGDRRTEGNILPNGLIVCVNERKFTASPEELIALTDRILILSSDVGG